MAEIECDILLRDRDFWRGFEGETFGTKEQGRSIHASTWGQVVRKDVGVKRKYF